MNIGAIGTLLSLPSYPAFLVGSTGSVVIGSYLTMVQTGSMDLAANDNAKVGFNSVQSGTLLVAAFATEQTYLIDSLVSLASTPTLNWIKANESANVADTCKSYIYQAMNTTTGKVSVTSSWSANSIHHCMTLYNISGSEAIPSGVSASTSARANSFCPITTSHDNSFILGMGTDWNANNADRTYLATPVSESWYNIQAGYYTVVNWWKLGSTSGSKYGMGYSAPSSAGNSINTLLYEVRPV